MIGSLLTLIQLKKEVPDSVGFIDYGAMTTPYPKEVFEHLKSTGFKCQKTCFCTHMLEVFNDSTKIQRNIKVLYSGGFLLSPRLKFGRRETSVDFEIKDVSKEILIKEIPPKETIYIDIYEPTKKFSIYQVLVGDHQLTPWKNRVAEFRRSYLTLKGFIFFVFLITFFSLSTYVLIEDTVAALDRKKKIGLLKKNGFTKCFIDFKEKQQNTDKQLNLEKRYSLLSTEQKGTILYVNGAKSLQDLKDGEVLIWCDFEEAQQKKTT
ncbi:hypothetical protein [Pseudoalteromonas piscicida]|uniref:hypothetical protein n=1 Tax=Pseudoalteromonas piscicida TaxID=43662 RepID=UPI0030A5C8CE